VFTVGVCKESQSPTLVCRESEFPECFSTAVIFELSQTLLSNACAPVLLQG